MTPTTRSVSDPASASGGRLQDFIAMAADVLEAYTAALLVKEFSGDRLKMVAHQTLSDHIVPGASVTLESGFWSDLVRGGASFHEMHFEGDSSSFGIYSEDQSIRAYMAAPVGDNGILWVDTRRTYRFTAKHIKILEELATVAGHLLDLSSITLQGETASREMDLISRVTPEWKDLADLDNCGLDLAVSNIRSCGEFDGVLTVLREDGTDLFRITACAGLSSWIRKGRLVRSKGGLAGNCTENMLPKIITERGDCGDSPVVFHKGERFGFPVRSLAVLPWSGPAGTGALVIVSGSPAPPLLTSGTVRHSLGKLIGLVHAAVFQTEVLKGIRRYDGESGLMSEGYFRQVSRGVFSRVSATKGSLVLLLFLVTDMDRLYLEHEHTVVNRFLEALTDRLLELTRNNVVAGKFRTGGFGLLIEGVPGRDVSRLAGKAESMFEGRSVSLPGEEISFQYRLATAHYPHECSDDFGLWRVALSKLEQPAGGT